MTLKELREKVEDLEDQLSKLEEMLAVFSPESQKDFIIDKALEYSGDCIRICKDVLHGLMEEIGYIKTIVRWYREEVRELLDRENVKADNPGGVRP